MWTRNINPTLQGDVNIEFYKYINMYIYRSKKKREMGETQEREGKEESRVNIKVDLNQNR